MTPTAAAPESPPRRMRTRSRRDWRGWAFVGPFMVVFVLVFIAPIAYAIYLSLFREQLIGGNTFVGLENFAALFADPQFWESFVRVRSSCWSRCRSCSCSPSSPRSRSTARGCTSRGFFRIVIFLPYAVPGRRRRAHVGVHLRRQLRPRGEHQRLARHSRSSRRSPANWILVSIGNIVTWEFVGYNMLIFYSALRTIPTELYEAAELDGAGRSG